MSEATLKMAALAILNGGASWCKGASARNAAGVFCSPLSPSAVTWDIEGALRKAQHDSTEPSWVSHNAVYATLRSKLPSGTKNKDIDSFNDSSVWSAIATLFA